MPRKTGVVRQDDASPVLAASMRPRPDAAENALRWSSSAGVMASMRPRPDAAENPAGVIHGAAAGRCFNEAAARCRGKRSFRATAIRSASALQ